MIFKTTEGTPFIFPGTGTGGWEVALTNTLSPGDKIVTFRYGQFSHLWIDMMQRLGLDVSFPFHALTPEVLLLIVNCPNNPMLATANVESLLHLATRPTLAQKADTYLWWDIRPTAGDYILYTGCHLTQESTCCLSSGYLGVC